MSKYLHTYNWTKVIKEPSTLERPHLIFLTLCIPIAEVACILPTQMYRIKGGKNQNIYVTLFSTVESGFVLILNFRELEQLKLGKMSHNLCHWKLFHGPNYAYYRDVCSSVLGSLTTLVKTFILFILIILSS